MKLSLPILVFAILIAGGHHAEAADADSLICNAPKDFVRLGTTLPATATAMRRGDDLVIVAIGSSSTSGVGASDRKHAYPARLENELRRIWPHQGVRVINKGIGGEDAPQMIARFERDVLSHNPDLVIWQAGTNMMLQHGSEDALLSLLRNGIRTLKAAHSDIILMDPQYAPKVTEVPSHPEFVAAIAQAASEQEIGLFHRFAAMQHWVAAGTFAEKDLIAPDRLHMNDVSYTCVARLLAAGIADAVRATPMSIAIHNGRDNSVR